MEVYRHASLPDASTHIRLLELLDPQSWEQSGTGCKLTTFRLADAPAYHAISYTWGDPTPKQHLHVDQAVLSVPDSSIRVLKQLAHFQTSRYYWIDAICIAQSNISEKNGQVAIMGDIYKKAQHVLVCLEDADDDADFSLRMMGVDGMPDLSNATIPKYTFPDPPIHFTTFLVQYLSAMAACHGQYLMRFFLSLTALSRRRYFLRVWIVQEMLLSGEASICCGKQRQPVYLVGKYMSMAHWIYEFITNRVYQNPKYQTPGLMRPKDWPQDLGSRLCAMKKEIFEMDTVVPELFDRYCHRQDVLRMEGHFPAGIPFRETLSLAENRGCFDGRDTVFGMLALVNWEDRTPIRPDYGQSAFAVAAKALQYEIPGYLGRQLVQNMRLTLEDSGLREALTERRQLPHSNASTLDHPRHFAGADYWQGRNIEKACTRIEEHTLDRTVFQVVRPCLPDETGFLATDFVYGDWIAFSRPNHPYPRLGIVLRREQGPRYSIVGHAYFPNRIRELEAKSTRPFAVVLTTEDFVTLVALHENVPTDAPSYDGGLASEAVRDLVRTRVCAEGSESYADII